jgi:FkbM family methyltransferase
METMRFAVGLVAVELVLAGDRICGSIAGRGPFEPMSLAKWAQLCARGGTVLDVGAYTGLFSIAAAKYGCRVLAFEPMEFNRARLVENAGINRVEVEISDAAVADAVGETTITYNPKVPFTSGASLIRLKGVKLPIRTVTIDSLELAEVTAIKIDTERGEPAVLRGAVETLKRCRPAILCEALGPSEAAAVMGSIEGYRRAGMLDGRNLLLRPC